MLKVNILVLTFTFTQLFIKNIRFLCNFLSFSLFPVYLVLYPFLWQILKVLCSDKPNLSGHTVQGVTIPCVMSLCALGCVTLARVLYVTVCTSSQHAIHTNLPSHLQTLLPILFGHYPTQTSTRTLSHFLQGMNTGM